MTEILWGQIPETTGGGVTWGPLGNEVTVGIINKVRAHGDVLEATRTCVTPWKIRHATLAALLRHVELHPAAEQYRAYLCNPIEPHWHLSTPYVGGKERRKLEALMSNLISNLEKRLS